MTMNSKKGTPFTAAAEVHPAMVDPNDAKEVTIPFCVLASGDEDKEAVKGFGENLTTKKHVETFGDQVHVSYTTYMLSARLSNHGEGLDGCSRRPFEAKSGRRIPAWLQDLARFLVSGWLLSLATHSNIS